MPPRIIPLTKGRVAIVDAADYEALAALKWHCWSDHRGYAYAVRMDKSGPKPRLVRMHRVIMGEPKGLMVDHINFDGLDNRRANLRVATRAENIRHQRNSGRGTSRYKGVQVAHRPLAGGRVGVYYRATIKFNGDTIQLGSHRSEIDAALAYDRAARELHGEFAVCNFPPGGASCAA